MKLVILNGSSCSGKSTIIKNMINEKERYFHLSYDFLKHSFSKYKSAEHYQEVQKVVMAVAETVLKMKYNIITDSVLYKASRTKLVKLAKKAGYEILEINLEADYKILAARFDQRVEAHLNGSGMRITNLSKKRFKELYEIFQQEKNPKAISFRTDTQSIEEVSKQVLKLL